MTKPLVRIVFKLQSTLDAEEAKQIFVLEVPVAGEVEVTLDRDEMGVPFIAESIVTPGQDFKDTTDETTVALTQVLDASVRLEIAVRRAQSALFIMGQHLAGDPL